MRTLAITLFTLTILVLPSVSLATTTGGIVPCDGPDCQACHVVQLGQNILTWFISIMTAVIALVFVIGGLKMVMAGGNEGEVTKARSMMTSAIIGFIILLASWLIVDTVMKTFVRGTTTEDKADDFLLGPWNEITCEKQPELIERPTGGAAVAGGIPASIPRNTEVIGTSMSSKTMAAIWLQELSVGSSYYNFQYIPVDRQGFSIPIRVPTLSQNMSLHIATLDQNGQLINNNIAEISNSRTIGSEVIASGVDRAKVILTPADSGRIIYYNFMPTNLRLPAQVQTAMWFYPSKTSGVAPPKVCTSPSLAGETISWTSLWGDEFPKPIYKTLDTTIVEHGYTAIKFDSDAVKDNGKLLGIENTSTVGILRGAISECPGDFDVAIECKYS